MTDRVHAAVNRLKATAREPVTDRPATEPEVQQLPVGDHAVLALRESAEDPVVVDTCSLSPYYGLELPVLGHRAKLGRRGRTGGLRALRERYGWTAG